MSLTNNKQKDPKAFASAPRSGFISTLSSNNPFRGPAALEREWGEPIRLRLGANESAVGCSPRAASAAMEALQRSTQYPDPLCYELRGLLAERHGVARDNIIVDCGVDGLLGLALRAFLNPGDIAVATAGTYPTFAYHVGGYGGVLYEVPYSDEDLSLDLPALVAAANQNAASVLYIANPDNPSGTYKTREELEAALVDLHPECAVLLDEAYIEFAESADLWKFLPDDRRIVFFRSFSKAYGLAGLRIGYAVADEAVISDFNKVRLHYGVSLTAQAAAAAAVTDTQHLDMVLTEILAGRHEYYATAETVGIKALPSFTNFVTFDLGDASLCASVFAELVKRRIFTYRPGKRPLDRCIRVTIGSDIDRRAFMQVFSDILRIQANLKG